MVTNEQFVKLLNVVSDLTEAVEILTLKVPSLETIEINSMLGELHRINYVMRKLRDEVS